MRLFDFIARWRKDPSPQTVRPARSIPPEEERRRAPRHFVPGVLDVYFWADTDVRYGDGELRDISLYGMRFVSDAHLSEGTVLELKIHFPRAFRAKEALEVRARVVRSYKMPGQARYRVGCEFVDMSGPTSSKLEEFLSWIKSNP